MASVLSDLDSKLEFGSATNIRIHLAPLQNGLSLYQAQSLILAVAGR